MQSKKSNQKNSWNGHKCGNKEEWNRRGNHTGVTFHEQLANCYHSVLLVHFEHSYSNFLSQVSLCTLRLEISASIQQLFPNIKLNKQYCSAEMKRFESLSFKSVWFYGFTLPFLFSPRCHPNIYQPSHTMAKRHNTCRESLYICRRENETIKLSKLINQSMI